MDPPQLYYRRTSIPPAPAPAPPWLTDTGAVTWARYETIGSTTLLLAAYGADGFSVYNATAPRPWTQVLNLPSLSLKYGSYLNRRIGPVVSGALLGADGADPVIALLTGGSPNGAASNVLLFISLSTLQLVHHLTFDAHMRAHEVKASPECVAVSVSAPGAIYVYRYTLVSAQSLILRQLATLTDVALRPHDHTPVFDLGRGGRFLAYAAAAVTATTCVPVFMCDPLEGEPVATDASSAGSVGDYAAPNGQHVRGAPSYSTTPHPAPHSAPYNTPPRPPVGSGIVADDGVFTADALPSGYVPPPHIRKMGENMLSGLRSVQNYVSTSLKENQGTAYLSRSVPAALHGFSTSPRLPQQFDPYMGDANSNAAYGAPTGYGLNAVHTDEPPLTHATVVVLDLKLTPSHPLPSDTDAVPVARPRVIASFRPYEGAVSALSLAPAAGFVLTAPEHAQFFDIFELRAPSPSAFNACNADDTDADEEFDFNSVWHRYRLNRGYTAGVVTMVSWAQDLKFIAVGTGKNGTVHVYAIQPFGGRPSSLRQHFQPGVANVRELQGLSVRLPPVCRIRTGDEGAEERASAQRIVRPGPWAQLQRGTIAPTLVFLSPGAIPTARRSATPAVDVLVFYPNLSRAYLQRLAPDSARAKLAAGTVTTVKSAVVAEWPLPIGGTTELVTSPAAYLPHAAIESQNPASEIEIETFSRSPRVVPKSIYQAQQFTFYTVDEDYFGEDLATGELGFLETLTQLHVRAPVEVKINSEDEDEGTLSTILRKDNVTEDTDLRPLVEYKPNFPNGLPGKYGYWRDCIGRPLTSSNVVFNEKFGKVKKEFIDGVVKQVQRLDLKLQGGADAAGAADVADAREPSLSFEDDDAVFEEYDGDDANIENDYVDFEQDASEPEQDTPEDATSVASDEPYVPFDDDEDFDRL